MFRFLGGDSQQVITDQGVFNRPRHVGGQGTQYGAPGCGGVGQRHGHPLGGQALHTLAVHIDHARPKRGGCLQRVLLGVGQQQGGQGCQTGFAGNLGFGAAFGPVVLFSVLWSRMTRNGALAGMIIGAVTVIVWKQFAWLGLYEIIPGFIFGSLGIVVFSLLGKAPSASMQKRFAEADAHYHSAPPSKLQAE